MAAIVLGGACVALSSPAPREDVFGAIGTGVLDLDGLAVEDIAALKLRHLDAVPAYDVLVLGNSRPLPLRAEHLGLAGVRFFNASLTGESLRSSVLLLERLRADGKLPHLALISFDHAELNYYSNPQWPPLWQRWGQMARDLAPGRTGSSVGLGDYARMASRHLVTEGTVLTRAFNLRRVRRGAAALWARVSGQGDGLAQPAAGQVGYHADGSRTQAPPAVPYGGEDLPPPNRNVLPGYLDYDLGRLAALRQDGLRVVIYETLLHPALHAAKMSAPSAVAAETRASLLALCARHGLECHAAPAAVPADGQPWPDAGHPPPEVMARWIKSFLKPQAQAAVQ